MTLAKTFGIMPMTKPFFPGPHPEHGVAVNRTHSYERGHGYFAKHFQYCQASNFAVFTVTRNRFPMVLNTSKINCLGSV